MKNPFLFGPLVSGDQFYDRADIERELLRAIENGTNVLLYGPRRYGKTSLVARVADQLRADGHPVVFFDMMKVNSLEHFIQSYASAALALKSRTTRSLDALARFLKGLRPKITLDDKGEPSLEMDFTAAPPSTQTLEEVLALPESIPAGKSNVLIVFDEFQEIERLSSSLPVERIFRSVIQRQRHVNYIFLGSRTHLLKRMFTDPVRPFYQSALVLSMGKPPRYESLDFLRTRFLAGGVTADQVSLETIIETSENIPYYLQALAYEVFEALDAQGRNTLCATDVPQALSRCILRMRDIFETTMENLSDNQRTLLSALAREPAGAFDSAYRIRHHLPVYTSVASALKVLVNKGLVESSRKSHRVGNPFLAAYLREPAYSELTP